MRRVSRSTLWRFLPIALPMVAALLAAMPSVDLTFQLRAGAEMLASGSIPSVDTWTFTAAGTPWLDQQWGSQLVLQLVFGALGWTGLALLRAVLVGLAFGLLLATVRRRAPNLGAIASALLVLAAFLVAIDTLALRAQLFAIVLFSATLFVLADRSRHPRAVWLIPVFALAWANLHGTFLFAPALCGLAWFADLYDEAAAGARAGVGTRPGAGAAGGGGAGAGSGGERRRRSGLELHRMLLVGLVATAATLINPFGPAVWGYVANLTSNPTIASRVSEWQPPSPLTVPGALTWLSVIAIGALVVLRLRTTWAAAAPASGPKRRGAFRATGSIPWPGLLTLLLFGGFALLSGRGAAWWPFVAVFVIAPWLASSPRSDAAATARTTRPEPALLRRLNATIAAALVVAAVALLPVWRPVGAASVPAGTLSYAPQGIVHGISRISCEQSGATGIWNPQAWGSWLEFAAPCRVYAVDSRIELFSATTWADVDLVTNGAPGWDEVLKEHRVSTVVTNHATDQGLETQLRASTDWSEVYSDADGSIWGSAAGGPATP
jgi:hypothetical protein